MSIRTRDQVQEEIIRAISMEPKGGHNLFYGGRCQAEHLSVFGLHTPELFMDKYASFFRTEECLQDQKINLDMKFQSFVHQVLDFL